MASTLVKLVASNLLRARPVASSPRFFNTKAFEYVQHSSEDECTLILERDVFTVAQAAMIREFSPHVSPAGNLARLLNISDKLIGFLHWPEKFPRWNAVEDDKALYILRNMTGCDNVSVFHENDVKESVPKSEFMSGINEKDVTESVSNKETVRLRDLQPFIELMRGVKSEPCEYYYHVMHGAEEIDSFAGSIRGTGTGRAGARISANIGVCSVLENPKAVYVIVGVEDPDTSDVYGGYAYELFLDDSLYDIRDVEMDPTSEMWKIIIPKKKGERTPTISGNLIFFREVKICKPTLWQPK